MTAETPDDIEMPGSDESPMAQMKTVFDDALEQAEDGPGAGDWMQLCIETGEQFAEIIVDNNERGLESTAKAYLNELADRHDAVHRSDVREIWQSDMEDLRRQQAVESGDAVIFADLIEETLTSVKKKVTTDKSSTSETEYVLKFDDAQNTKLTCPQGTVYEQRDLWKAYTAAQVGNYPERVGCEEVEWDNFISQVFEDVGETVESETGPRHSALQALENHVKEATAYGNVVDAIEHGGVYVDAEPPEHTEVRVPREAVASVTSTHEITDRALQAEISARGVSSDNLPGSKVSKSTTIEGRWQTFWHLSADKFDEVGTYKEEAIDPIDRMDDAPPVEDDDENDDDDESGDVVNDDDDGGDDGDDDGAPGRIGSSGGDDDR